MKRIFLLVATLIAGLFPPLLAQPTLEWTKSWSFSEGYPVETTDASGNVYIVSTFKGTRDFDPGPDTFNLTSLGLAWTLFIVKLDDAGHFLWAKEFACDGQLSEGALSGSITTDDSGNIYLTGAFSGTVDFDPGNSVYNLTYNNSNLREIFILKLDSAGNFLWVRVCQPFNNSIWGSGSSAIAINNNSGSVYVVGAFSGTVDFDGGPNLHALTSGGYIEPFILKLDINGNFIWVKKLEGAQTQAGATDLVISSSGSLYVSGYFNETVDFDPGFPGFYLSAVGSGFSAFVCKLDENGNFIWARHWGSLSKSTFANQLAVNAQEDVYVLGEFQQTMDFNPGPNINTLTGGGKYLLKLNAAGSFKWVKGLLKNNFVDPDLLALDAQGNPYLAGGFRESIDFDPGPDTLNITSTNFVPFATNNYPDVYLLSLNAEGNFQWVRTMGGIYSDACSSISIRNNHIYFAGTYWTTLDMDPSEAVFNLPPVAGEGIFMTKWQQSLVAVHTPSERNVHVYPNPARSFITVDLGETPVDVQATVYSSAGKLIYQNGYKQTTLLNIALDAAAGTYFLRLSETDGHQSVYKVILE